MEKIQFGGDGVKVLLKGARVPCGGGFERLDVLTDNGVVIDMKPDVPEGSGDLVFFLPGHTLLPGLCDLHVHLREPGFSSKETMRTGTQAAARGGVTLVCAMPNLEPAPDTADHLAVEQTLIDQHAVVPVRPYGCITMKRAGAKVVDMFQLAPRVVGFTDDGSGVQDDAVMAEAFRQAAACDALVAAHCEDARFHTDGWVHDGAFAQKNGWPGIPSASEHKQVERDITLAAEAGARYHVCHISAKESVALVRAAKAEGHRVSCEVTPHHIALCDEDIADDGRYKMAPPLRTAQDRAALIEGLLDGTIDAIATDHAPHTKAEKAKGLAGSANGVVGLETSFAVCYTRLVRPGLIDLARLVELMSAAPRRLAGAGDNTIRVGAPLDAVAVELDTPYTIDPAGFASMGRSTPFKDMAVYGRPVMTWAAGELVYNGLEAR